MTSSTITAATAAAPVSRPRIAWRLARRAAGESVSGWLAPGLTATYAAAAALVAFVGLSAGGTIQAQEFGRTAQSLLTVTLWIVPLAAALAGAIAVADDGELTLLLAQPLRWRTVFLARLAGTAGALAAATLVAWGFVGLVVGILAGWRDVAGYLAVGAVALASVFIGVALGGVAGALGGRRGRAIVLALALWFALGIAYDLVAIAVVSLSAANGAGGFGLSVLAAANPFDAIRVLGTLGIGGRDLAFGAVTASLEQSGTAHLPALLAASFFGWTAASLGLGAWVFSHRDR
jgi:Cu-processing system permease protein